MAQILRFPSSNACAPLRVRSGQTHEVWVRVLDRTEPEEARWHLQWAVQRAASFRALKGFDDGAARRREWHRFEIGRTQFLRRFLRDVRLLVAAGRVSVEVDGADVQPAPRRVA